MNRAIQIALVLAIVSPALAALTEDAEPSEPAPQDQLAFAADIQPFFKRYCVQCHRATKAKANFRLDDISENITAGDDIERWEKVLEMLSIGDMPPPEKSQPEKSARRQVEAWILAELRKIGRGPDDARLNRPEFGNRVDHDELFSGEHRGPASSPPRMWRKSNYIYRSFVQQQRLLAGGKGGNPFAPLGGHGFKDFGHLPASEATILTLRNNADAFIAELIDGRLRHPKGPDGKEDKTRRVRDGKSRFREFHALAHDGAEPNSELLRKTVERAFTLLLQRKPNVEELERYSDGFLQRAIEIAGSKEGLKSLLSVLILSPEFVYRQEIGQGRTLPDGRRMLSPNETAYAIAFALTDSPPDKDLRKAVEEGQLSSKDDVAREVRRMLSTSTRKYWAHELTSVEGYMDRCPNPRILRFFREFFGYEAVFNVFKDKERNHHHRPLFIFKDADLFVLSILEEDRQVIEKLLTSDRYVVHYASAEQAERKLKSFRERKSKRELEMLERGITPALGGYRGGHYFTTYGLDYETWNYPIEQPFRVANRAGMLTHPAWLVAHSGNFDTDPIRRGKWIREHLLADTIPEIPIGVDAKIEDDPHKTLRERLDKTTTPECWRCHKKMNPLGLPFESFDDFGRFRENFYFAKDGKIGGTFYEREKAILPGNRRGGTPVEYTTRSIETAGALAGTRDPKLDGPVENVFDLLDRLSRSERVRQSFVRHAFRYWMGRNETLDDSPTLMAADRSYVNGDGSFKELLVSLLTSDSFLTRRDPE